MLKTYRNVKASPSIYEVQSHITTDAFPIKKQVCVTFMVSSNKMLFWMFGFTFPLYLKSSDDIYQRETL